MNDTLDFERRLSRAMHELAPTDFAEAPQADAGAATHVEPTFVTEPIPLATRRRRSRLAVGGAVGLAAAASVAVALSAASGGSDSGPVAAGERQAPACQKLVTRAASLPGETGGKNFSLSLRNTGATCSVNSVSVRTPDGTVTPAAASLPVVVPSGKTLALRVEYRDTAWRKHAEFSAAFRVNSRDALIVVDESLPYRIAVVGVR